MLNWPFLIITVFLQDFDIFGHPYFIHCYAFIVHILKVVIKPSKWPYQLPNPYFNIFFYEIHFTKANNSKVPIVYLVLAIQIHNTILPI